MINKKNIFKKITYHPDLMFEKAIKSHKKYYKAKESKNFIRMIFYGRKANKYSRKYNLELYGKLGENLKIWHGNIIINADSCIGDNVQFHGNNCIGNNGITDGCPKIGNNVEIGFGSTIIGNIKIANNIKIGSNSLVNKDFLEPNVIIAGVPAKIIKRCNDDKNSGNC